MVQNRNKLIDQFIGNIANAIVHDILEKAIDRDDISTRYLKELTTSIEAARKYREKINPSLSQLPAKDAVYIKQKIILKVNTELRIRISKGYTNINFYDVDNLVDEYLKRTAVI